MNLPTHLRVGHYRVKVQTCTAHDLEDTGNIGEFHRLNSRIRLRTDKSASVTRDTLLHEALHAALFCHGLSELLNLTDEDEERLVTGLTPALLDLLRCNPKLVAYLVS